MATGTYFVPSACLDTACIGLVSSQEVYGRIFRGLRHRAVVGSVDDFRRAETRARAVQAPRRFERTSHTRGGARFTYSVHGAAMGLPVARLEDVRRGHSACRQLKRFVQGARTTYTSTLFVR